MSCSAPRLSGYAEKKDLAGHVHYDFNQNKIRDNGKGFAVSMKALGAMPKRVALISFYVDDPGLTKKSGTAQTGRSYNTTNTGSGNARQFAGEFFNDASGELRTVFASYGMTLLMPDEFLTSEAKKRAYKEFEVKHTVANRVGNKIGGFFKNVGNSGTTLETDEAAEGFRLIKINTREEADPKKKAVEKQNLAGSMDSQMIESVGYELAKALEVDAVLVIYNTQLADEKWNKSRFYLAAASMVLFGPNPTPLQEGKKDNMFYSKGLFYCGTRISFKKGLLINPKIKDETLKAENEKKNSQAYRNILSGCANKMGGYLQKELARNK